MLKLLNKLNLKEKNFKFEDEDFFYNNLSSLRDILSINKVN